MRRQGLEDAVGRPLAPPGTHTHPAPRAFPGRPAPRQGLLVRSSRRYKRCGRTCVPPGVCLARSGQHDRL